MMGMPGGQPEGIQVNSGSMSPVSKKTSPLLCNVIFGKMLRDLRISKGFTQEALAVRADLDRTYIGDMERGIYSPTLVTLLKLSQSFDMEIHDFMNLFARAYGSNSRQQSHSNQ